MHRIIPWLRPPRRDTPCLHLGLAIGQFRLLVALNIDGLLIGIALNERRCVIAIGRWRLSGKGVRRR